MKNGQNTKEPWYDGTKYECGVCKNVFKETDSLNKHFRSLHYDESSPMYSLKAFTDSLIPISKSYHRCKICQEEVMRNRKDIRWHLRSSHNKLTFLEYDAKFYFNSGDRFLYPKKYEQKNKYFKVSSFLPEDFDQAMDITQEDIHLLEKAEAAEKQGDDEEMKCL